MLKTSSALAPLFLMLTLSAARGQEYNIEVIDAAPDADEISESLAKQFADKGIRVQRGSTRTACEIWFCKRWAIDAGFEVTDERLYPFSPGQLIGLLHFGRRGSDFRDQTVSSGWYTLRFGLQPIDGNHEGTSPTRDFLMMIAADQDDLNKDWDIEELLEESAEAAGGSHPAMLCLLRATEGDQLAIRHDDRTDWWILHAVGTGASGDKTKAVPFDLVVVGHADE
jgi:hypothetical protein